MRKRPLGTTGITVSELALGTWGLSGDGYAAVSEEDQDAVIDRALALGVTLFDTADGYGRGAMETRLGRRLEKHPSVVVATKLGTDRDAAPSRKDFSPSFIRDSFERSRERLKRDVVDVVLLHNPSERTLERGQAAATLTELKEAGAIRAWGASVEGVSVARSAMEHGAQVIEISYNAFHNRALRQLANDLKERGVGVLARSVLAHGLLCGQWPLDKEFASTDHRSLRWSSDDLKRRISQLNALRPVVDGNEIKSLRAAALRFVLANDVIASAVLGPRSPLQLDQLLRDAGKTSPYLSEAAMEALLIRLDNVGITA